MNVNISGLKAESFTRLLRALNLVWNFHPQLRIFFSMKHVASYFQISAISFKNLLVFMDFFAAAAANF